LARDVLDRLNQLAEHARRRVRASSPAFLDALSGPELVVMAFLLSGLSVMEAHQIVDQLSMFGADPVLVERRLREHPRQTSAFRRIGAAFVVESLPAFASVAARLLGHSGTQPLAAPQRLRVREPAVASVPRPGASPKVAQRRGVERTAKAGAREAAPQAAARPPTAARPPAPAATVPASLAPPEPDPDLLAPSLLHAATVVTAPEAGELMAVVSRGRASVEDVLRCLDAHALMHAGHFEELLSPATLVGVDAHVFQHETVRRVLRTFRGRALLADEVGLGKTVEAIMILREYQLRGMVRRALVLTPPALVRQWAGELAAKAGLAPVTTDDALLRDDPEAFWRSDGVVVASLGTARMARHAPLVQGRAWDMVIVDEAHHVKNRTTQGFKLVDGIVSRFLLLLTATPVETSLDEIYNIVTLLRPGHLATLASFKQRFVDTKQPTRPKDRESLRELLREVMIRNTRAQSGLRLPPRWVSTVMVEPTTAERELYRDVLETFRRHVTEGPSRVHVTTLLLEAGSSVEALRGTLGRLERSEGTTTPALRADAARLGALCLRVNGSKKIDALLDLVRGTADQVLIFSRFRDTVESISAALRDAGVSGVVAFHGGMGRDAKAAATRDFAAGARCMVATDVGAEGMNLQFCHVLVNFDLPWNPMLLEQRIGRLHRIGQTEEVRVLNFCARETIEERVLDVLDRRLSLFELVVGEMDLVLGNLTDERDLEERVLQIVANASDDQAIETGFAALGDELLAGRGAYERTRALEDALFGEDFEA